MEIERKFLIRELPKKEELEKYKCLSIEQGYLCREPVIRIRKQEREYWLTYKGKGLMTREEYNLPLNQEAYEHLKTKIDGKIIIKKRYIIPIDDELKVELDIFEGFHKGKILAEVEFPDEETAVAFQPLSWFGEEVTYQKEYHNSHMSL